MMIVDIPPELPARPVAREDLSRVFIEGIGRLSTSIYLPDNADVDEFVQKYMTSMVAGAEWFDFGVVDGPAISGAAGDAQPFFESGLIVPPYPNCIFRYRSVADSANLPDNVRAALSANPDVDIAPPGQVVVKECALFIWQFGDLDSPVVCVAGCEIRGARADTIIVEHVAVMQENGQIRSMGTFMEGARSIYSVYSALWLILNAKGVDRTVREPDEKLNRARAKRGKAPLRRVTVVDAAQYMRALQETERMDRATGVDRQSPRMHLRRAHLRRLANGTTIVIHAMIVNAHKDPALREGYKVIHR